MKKLVSILVSLLFTLSVLAQTGGVRATVVNRAGRAPIQGAQVSLFQGSELLASATSDAEGKFEIGMIANGNYLVSVEADGFTAAQVNIKVENGLIRDLIFVTLTQAQTNEDVDSDSFAEFDLQDSGYSDAPTILFSSDVYSNVAGYGFSSIRFKNRGYNSETQDVYFGGVKLNDAITGYSPFSLWSGLNEATRSKETTMGIESADFGLGGYNGMTNIVGDAASVRPGLRFSALTNSALYRLRLMGSYATGRMDNGWAYAVNVSARLGGNDWVKGVFYNNFSYYVGADRNWGDVHRLSLEVFASTGRRGAQNASTQEVYDLMGDNMYNSNWGYQNGQVRNSRVRLTNEPVFVARYAYTPSRKFNANVTFLWRTGSNGYTALDWYDAADPRPDYYRNLPSYYYMDDGDYNRVNEDKYEWAKEVWSYHSRSNAKYYQLDWDRLYNVNYNSADGRSKYALEERHVDQNDLNLATSFKYSPSDVFTLLGGLSFRYNVTDNYKKVNDLLGGKYYLNIDSFAERDYAAYEERVQNDLDYYLAHGKQAEKVGKGGVYGYDYLANVRDANLWLNAVYKKGGFNASIGGRIGYNSFWRDGLMRKGLFPGTQEDVAQMNSQYGLNLVYNGQTSKGKSAVSSFLTYAGKASIGYTFGGGHRISANAGYFSDAPTFNGSFISPRTRNTLMPGLTNKKTISADINYQYSGNGIDARITGFWTKIKDQSDVMSFYDDTQSSFTNFAMTGIDQRHMGVELGIKVPTPVQNLTVSGVLSLGEYIYTGTPHMVQTVDNSAEVIRDEDIPYWSSHPIFKRVKFNGETVYDEDANGYIVDYWKKHYVPSTPQLASEIAINYRYDYWFFEVNGQYFANSYLDMNPLYRTHLACGGADGIETASEIEYMAAQEKFAPAFLLNCSIGKSWYIQRKYNIGFSLNASNLLNNRGVKTGGYEQTRLISSAGKDRYYRFDSKYFYMQGANYMLNIYFRF